MRQHIGTTTVQTFASYSSPPPVAPSVPSVGTEGLLERVAPPGPTSCERLSSPASGREPAASLDPGGICQPEGNHRVERAQPLLVPGGPAATGPGTVPGTHLTSHPVKVFGAELAVRGKLPARGLVASRPNAWIRHVPKTTITAKGETPRSLRGRSSSTRLGEYPSCDLKGPPRSPAGPKASECAL